MKYARWGLASLVLAGALGAQAAPADDAVDGLLESRGDQSALWVVSPGSGDLIGYTFANSSAVGRRILGQCLAGLPCVLEGMTERELSSAQAAKLSFSGQPVVWLEVRSFKRASIGSGVDEYLKEVRTRHGLIQADDDRMLLSFRGKPLLPADSGVYSVVRHLELGRNDVLLVQSRGGTGCPATYYLVTVSAKGAVVSEEFGGCSDLVHAFVEEGKPGQAERLVIRMPGFAGPFSSAQDHQRAARTLREWTYQAGRLTQTKPTTSAQR